MRIREAHKHTDPDPKHYAHHTRSFSSNFPANFARKKMRKRLKRRMRTWRERPGGGWVGGAGPCPPVRGRPGTAPPSPPHGSRQTAAADGGRALLSPCLKGQLHEMSILRGVLKISYQQFLCVCWWYTKLLWRSCSFTKLSRRSCQGHRRLSVGRSCSFAKLLWRSC